MYTITKKGLEYLRQKELQRYPKHEFYIFYEYIDKEQKEDFLTCYLVLKIEGKVLTFEIDDKDIKVNRDSLRKEALEVFQHIKEKKIKINVGEKIKFENFSLMFQLQKEEDK